MLLALLKLNFNVLRVGIMQFSYLSTRVYHLSVLSELLRCILCVTFILCVIHMNVFEHHLETDHFSLTGLYRFREMFAIRLTLLSA